MGPLAHSARNGNPPQTYADHVGNVIGHHVYGATVNASRVARYRPRDGQAFIQTVGIAAEYHDLGKLDDRNQAVLSRSSKEGLPVNHVDAGVCHLLAEKATRWAALLVYGHHAYKPHLGLPSLPGEMPAPGRFRDPNLLGQTEQVLRDLVARHHKSFPSTQLVNHLSQVEPSQLFLRFALSCLVDADHADTAHHQGQTVPQVGLALRPAERLASLDRYVERLAKEKTNARTGFRVKVYQAARNAPTSSSMFACDSPVGTGKTTAIMAHLLRAAVDNGLRRVFVVLPFTNIIEQSVAVYRDALTLDGERGEEVVAAHHHRADFESLEAREYAFRWHAPVVVVTAVQFFETLASNNPAALRKLHQLAGSTIFIDEAHAALPIHLWPQAWRWLKELSEEWGWGCHVVLASGSLNRFWELEDLVNPPVKDLPELLPPDCREETGREESRRVVYRTEEQPLRLEQIPGYLAKLAGPRLMIVNTVQSAAAIADFLNVKLGRVSCEHLSTALCPRDRHVTLEHVKNRLRHGTFKEWTLVATSCVEAGVDFSFRTGLRERASLTSLLQTAGRVNRECEFGLGVPVIDFQLAKEAPFTEHPAFTDAAAVLAGLFEAKMVAPEYCREALRKEAQRDNPAEAIKRLLRAEDAFDFPEVAQLFRVIATDTRTVLVDQEVQKRLESKQLSERPHWKEIMESSVQIWASRLDEGKWPLKPIGHDGELWAWIGKYDSFLGYMAWVIEALKAGDTGFGPL